MALMRRGSSLKFNKNAVDSPVLISAAVFVTCLLIVAGLAVADSLSKPVEGIRTAAEGDTVSVDYIGYYDNGMVFDTSLWSVASNNSIQKSFSFTLKSESEYQPLKFTIGSNTLLSGFERAVIGLAVGEEVTVIIPAAEAYGLIPDSQLVVYDLVQNIPMRQTMNLSEFESFYGEPAADGLCVTHPIYAWDVCVNHYDPDLDEVSIINLPSKGEKYWSYGEAYHEGWYVEVVSVGPETSPETITIKNLLGPESANNVCGVDADGKSFFISYVDRDVMHFKYAEERIGQNLTFKITLNKILS